MTDRKRQIGHWNQGKACKGNRKAKEKAHVDQEIKEQLDEQDPNYRTKHYTHTPNHIARTEHQVRWYTQAITDAERSVGGWQKRFINSYRSVLRKAKAKLARLKKDKP